MKGTDAKLNYTRSNEVMSPEHFKMTSDAFIKLGRTDFSTTFTLKMSAGFHKSILRLFRTTLKIAPDPNKYRTFYLLRTYLKMFYGVPA